jgi:hypothetical protein
MAGFGLFELGLELFALPPLLFVLPSLLFINAVNYFFILTFNGFVGAKIVYSCVIVECFWLRVLALIKVKILLCRCPAQKIETDSRKKLLKN